MLDGHVAPNPYYEPPDLVLGEQTEADRVGWMLRQLRRLKGAEAEREQRVREQAAQIEAERGEQRITTIPESITDAFFALDHGWRFTYLNHQAEQF